MNAGGPVTLPLGRLFASGRALVPLVQGRVLDAVLRGEIAGVSGMTASTFYKALRTQPEAIGADATLAALSDLPQAISAR